MYLLVSEFQLLLISFTRLKFIKMHLCEFEPLPDGCWSTRWKLGHFTGLWGGFGGFVGLEGRVGLPPVTWITLLLGHEGKMTPFNTIITSITYKSYCLKSILEKFDNLRWSLAPTWLKIIYFHFFVNGFLCYISWKQANLW